MLGAISGMYERMYHGIIPQAALATLGTAAAMLFAYKTGVLRATNGFVMGVAAATGGIALMYFVAIIASMFGVSMPFLHQPSLIGIGISVRGAVAAAAPRGGDRDSSRAGRRAGAVAVRPQGGRGCRAGRLPCCCREGPERDLQPLTGWPAARSASLTWPIVS